MPTVSCVVASTSNCGVIPGGGIGRSAVVAGLKLGIPMELWIEIGGGSLNVAVLLRHLPKPPESGSEMGLLVPTPMGVHSAFLLQ